MSVVTTPAVLLRAYNYSETSRILRFYTRDVGLLGVMAKGVRRSSGRGGSGMETFAAGRLTVQYKETRDLQTLREFSTDHPHRGLASNVVRFAGASILAELILEQAGSDPNPEVFDRLSAGLRRVESAPEPALVGVLLVEAWGLVAMLGYSPQIEPCVHCEREMAVEDLGRFDFAAGGVRCPSCAAEIGGPLVGPVARRQLQRLLHGSMPEDLRKPRAQLQLLSDFVTYHLAEGRPLRSFAFLSSLLAATGTIEGERE